MVKSEEQDSVGLVASKTPIWIATDKTASMGVHFSFHFSFFMMLPAGFEHCVPYPAFPISICLAGEQGQDCLSPARP